MQLSQLFRQHVWMKWLIAGVLAIALVAVVYRLVGTDEQAELLTVYTITCRETGETWQMRLATMEVQLLQRSFPLNLDEGFTNPKTGKPTGFPENWEKIVQSVTAMREAELAVPPTPPQAPTPPPP